MKRNKPLTDTTHGECHFTTAQVAKRYGVRPRTVRSWIKRNWLRAMRKGRLIRISQSALDDFDKNY